MSKYYPPTQGLIFNPTDFSNKTTIEPVQDNTIDSSIINNIIRRLDEKDNEIKTLQDKIIKLTSDNKKNYLLIQKLSKKQDL